MSRLDAIAELLRVDTDEARSFTKSVRARFETAPSYAEIQRALRANPGGRASVDQVVGEIKRMKTVDTAPKARVPRGGPSAGFSKRRPKRRKTSEHHKEQYGRKKREEPQ
ncbi:MAG: hypothetical protein ACYC4R_03570 [Anaerolineae bacterium]